MMPQKISTNSLDPDQDWHSDGPDQEPNCLQRLSADDKSPLARKGVNETWQGPGLQISVCINWKLIFLFLNQNICCGYSKGPSHLSFVWFDFLHLSQHFFCVMSGWGFLSWTSTKQGLMCLAKWLNAVMPMSNPQPLGHESSTLPLP